MCIIDGKRCQDVPRFRNISPAKTATVEDLLHPGDAPVDRKVRPADTHRLTPESRAYIVTYVIAGYSDREINALLRKSGMIWPGEPDLSRSTLWRIRQSDDCLLDPELLTPEARQVGHNILSEIVVDMTELCRKSLGRLLRRENFGFAYDRINMSDNLTAVRLATDFLFNTFALGLPERLQKELEQDGATPQGESLSSMTPEQLCRYFEGIMAASYQAAVKRIEDERRRAGAVVLELAGAEPVLGPQTAPGDTQGGADGGE